jgi:hypothetical protein
MSLTPDQIKKILAKPQRKSGKKKTIDTSVRDVTTWFALSSKTRDEMGNDLKCDNSNCVDPRPVKVTALGNEVRHQFVVEIDGQNCCRHCFLDGWLLKDPAQDTLV